MYLLISKTPNRNTCEVESTGEPLQICYDVTIENETSLFKHYKTDLTLKWSVACINAFSLSVGLWHSHWVANMEKTRILWFIIRIIILQIWAGITQLHKCEGAGREIHIIAFNSKHWSLFCGDHPCFCATVGWEVDLRLEESHLGGLKVPLVSVAQHMGHRTWHQDNQVYA